MKVGLYRVERNLERRVSKFVLAQRGSFWSPGKRWMPMALPTELGERTILNVLQVDQGKTWST